MYEFVKKDLESFYPKIKKDGYITGDDYHGDDHEAWWHGDIKKAVDEFVSPGVCEKVLMRNNQFILRKSADEPHAAPIGAFIRLRFFLLYVLRSRRGTRKRIYLQWKFHLKATSGKSPSDLRSWKFNPRSWLLD